MGVCYPVVLCVAAINALNMYCVISDKEATKKKDGLPRKWNGLEFLCELIFDLMRWQSDDAEVGNNDDFPVSSNSLPASASVAGLIAAAASLKILHPIHPPRKDTSIL